MCQKCVWYVVWLNVGRMSVAFARCQCSWSTMVCVNADAGQIMAVARDAGTPCRQYPPSNAWWSLINACALVGWSPYRFANSCFTTCVSATCLTNKFAIKVIATSLYNFSVINTHQLTVPDNVSIIINNRILCLRPRPAILYGVTPCRLRLIKVFEI